MKKKLLILEKSSANLEQRLEDDGSIVLSGIFTTFGVRNRNNRIYESNDFLKQIEQLQPKIKSKTLLGQLDHPQNFDISLADVSHVIESLEYDKAGNCIVGKIRLLNTSKGKEAQALIKDGIPLHISSRAAGTVNESGVVKCEKLFTYDLVADPGFANAVLTRVNESYGYEDDLDTVEIYDMNPEVPAPSIEPASEPVAEPASEPVAEPNALDITTNDCGDENKTIKYDDFVAYTTYLSKIITDLQSKISGIETKLGEGCCENSCEEFDEKLNQVIKYADYISESINKSDINEISKLKEYVNYLAENLNKHEKYMNYVAENVNNHEKYMNYVAENVNKHEEYMNYVAENVEKQEQNVNNLAESLNKHEEYMNYVAENINASNIEKVGEYLNYLSEKLNGMDVDDIKAQTIANKQDIAEIIESIESQNNVNTIFAEKIDNAIHYTEFVAEKLEKTDDALIEQINIERKNFNMINENNVVANPVKNENSIVNNKTNTRYTDNIDMLSEMTNTIVANVNAYKKQNDAILENQRIAQEAEAKRLAEADAKKDINNLMNYVPEDLKSVVEALSPMDLESVLESAKYYRLDTPSAKENFWRTRKLNNIAYKDVEGNTVVTENKVEGYNDKQMDILKAQADRMRRSLGLYRY